MNGNTTVATGTKSADFAHRFSTKPLDVATGLYYYLYRWYDAPNGRWPSRDPIEEQGGVNLYGFVGNDGINQLDVLGLTVIDSFSQAIKHYWFGLGQGTTAGQNVINNLRNSKGWIANKKAVEEAIKKSLTEVSCCDLNGTIERKGKDIGIYAEDNILGHVTLEIDDYTVDWSTSHTGKSRLIEGTTTRKVSFSDKFTFEVDLTSPNPKQILTDVIPAILAIDGSGYTIDGDFKDKITLSVNQTCP